jgi:hypothetical protein
MKAHFPTVPAVLALLPLAALPFAGACSGAPPGEPRALEPDLDDRPQSAYAALVRTLEALDAIRSPYAAVRLRAIQCDSMVDSERGLEYVRVVLDLTVLAHDFDTAGAVFLDLERALDVEAGATARLESVAPHRIARVFDEMDWSARDLDDSTEFERLVSISDSIRLEVHRGASEAVLGLDDGVPGRALGESEAMGTYIRAIAASDATRIGEVETRPRVDRPRRGTSDLRYRIRPLGESFSRGQIGRFLHELEARSPGVRVTHVAIEPGEPGEDVREDAWTFEADVSVRLRT